MPEFTQAKAEIESFKNTQKPEEEKKEDDVNEPIQNSQEQKVVSAEEQINN